MENIKPTVEKARLSQTQGGYDCDFLCKSVKTNVKLVAEKIRTASPIVAEEVEDGSVKIVGAYYRLDSGEIKLTYKPNL